ncbi:MAG: hypothetical protein AB8B63_22455 [Granulosicoccus sp.]
MNPELNLLQPYPFQKLSELLANTTPAAQASGAAKRSGCLYGGFARS